MIKDFFKTNNIEFIEDAPLINHNTYHIKSYAKFLVFPKNIDEVIIILKYLKNINMEYIFLGNGSNIILANKVYDKVFIKLDRLNYIKYNGNQVTAGAGTSLIKLALDCALNNLSGYPFSHSIPSGNFKKTIGTDSPSISPIFFTEKEIFNPSLVLLAFKSLLNSNSV